MINKTVKKGDKIKVHYTGKLTNGEVFDSSSGRDPLAFEVGAGMMIPGFDAGVEGMGINESKTINIEAKDGYGDRNDEHVFNFPLTRFPEDMVLEAGQQLTLQSADGRPFPVVVIEVTETDAVLDANHFLAGKDLVFDITLVEIEA